MYLGLLSGTSWLLRLQNKHLLQNDLVHECKSQEINSLFLASFVIYISYPCDLQMAMSRNVMLNYF